MLIALLCSNIFLFSLCCVTSYYVVKFGRIILDVQDAINESLDELDESYMSINEILKKPVFFDSIEVRKCINEIKSSRDAIIKVALKMTSINNERNNMLQDEIGEEIVTNKREEEI
jgi:hypothetical protein